MLKIIEILLFQKVKAKFEIPTPIVIKNGIKKKYPTPGFISSFQFTIKQFPK